MTDHRNVWNSSDAIRYMSKWSMCGSCNFYALTQRPSLHFRIDLESISNWSRCWVTQRRFEVSRWIWNFLQVSKALKASEVSKDSKALKVSEVSEVSKTWIQMVERFTDGLNSFEWLEDGVTVIDKKMRLNWAKHLINASKVAAQCVDWIERVRLVDAFNLTRCSYRIDLTTAAAAPTEEPRHNERITI